ncbi:hypothetical protein WJ32_08525 [Burkholderia ubonensis]|uniref:Uncharacterized protein n=1 Tax=Burkholderia ubonensis TaxID=101571 RepID=A0A118HLP4_9BURK|nr:phage tail protein [Burkholderia ubonensis]AOJ62498.1 hypothetical protein WJ32_08525 [Burkholderia ubonensis]KVG56461.1 hypothetical protein WJ33_37190 [Burkholderia ubonensis]
MGQSVGLILGVAGAVVGGFFSGGATWAIGAGFLAGNLVGSILTPHKQPQLPEIRVQDSAYGKYIARVYGKYRLSGNIIWVGPAHQHSQSGKGAGGKGPQQSYVTMSLAVALCKGPITAVTRIWANGKLIYDISNPSNFQAISGSAQMVTNFTVYPGDENQTADPVMQGYLGAANVPAYRGLAYVVFNELNLQQWGNYMPSLSFEVVKTGGITYVTSGAQNAGWSPAMQTLVGNGALTNNIGTQIDAAGNVYGWSCGNNGNNCFFQPFKLTPYGVQWQSAPAQYFIVFPILKCQSQDEPGIATTSGLWLQNSGGVMNTGFSTGLIGNWNVVKAGGKIYYSQTTGANPGPVYISNPVLAGSALPISVITGAYASDCLFLLGVSANYIYAVTPGGSGAHPNSLIKLDLNGNLVAVLDGPNASAYGLAACGQVISDNQIYISNSGHIYFWNGTTLVDTGMPSSLGGNMSVLKVISQGTLAYQSEFASGYTFSAVVASTNASDIPLSSVVAAECQYAGLQSSQYDVSQLTDLVTGYAITGNASPRDALNPLMSAYFFDACDTGGPLKFVRRGGTPALTIPWDDLGADPDGRAAAAQNPLSETVQQEFELPRQMTLTYASANTDYQSGTQRESMPQTTSNLDESADVPIVLPDNEAKVRVQTMLWERWIKRQTFQWSVQMKYLAVEPGDVVSITNPAGTTYNLRVTKVAGDGKNTLTMNGDPSVPQIYPNPATYVAQGGVAQGFTKQSVPYSGATILKVLDVPPLRDQDTSQGLYVAACGFNSAWPGATIDISRDDLNFTQLMAVTQQNAVGTCSNALGNFFGGNIADELNSLQVVLYNTSLTLSSVSYASFLNGANAALVGGELVYFRTATQTGPGAYTLTGFLRGVKGTEASMGAHVPGEDFVLLDQTKLSVTGINISDIGQPLYFEPFLLNIFGNTAGGVTQVTPVRARVKPLMPWLLGATKGSSSSANDITLRWLRRARVNTYWLSGADVPLDESVETYNVTVLNGTNAVRQLTVTGPFNAPTIPNWTYTAAQITADGFNTGNTITFQVYQNSDQGVPGYVATTTIVR